MSVQNSLSSLTMAQIKATDNHNHSCDKVSFAVDGLLFFWREMIQEDPEKFPRCIWRPVFSSIT